MINRLDVSVLFEHMQPAAAAIRSARSGEAGEAVVMLLSTGAFHLAAASLGARLYERARVADHTELFQLLGEDPTTVEVAATDLVCHSNVSAIDVTCGALARLGGAVTQSLSPSTHEKDFGSLSTSKGRASLAQFPKLLAWLDSLAVDPDWKELVDIRHQVTHKRWRRDVTILGSSSSASGPPPPFAANQVDITVGTGAARSLETALGCWYQVGLGGWLSCCNAISAESL